MTKWLVTGVVRNEPDITSADAACPGVFEVTWSDDGRATFSYGAERVPGQPHVIWRQIGSFARQVQ